MWLMLDLKALAHVILEEYALPWDGKLEEAIRSGPQVIAEYLLED